MGKRLSKSASYHFLGRAWFCGLLLALATPSRADDANLATLHANTALAFAALSATLAQYQSLPCLTDEARDHLSNLQSNATVLQTSLDRQYQSYMTRVQKPMEGTGKCDGGFNAVAVESESRRAQSAAFASQVGQAQNQLGQAVNADFDSAEIDMPDESESQSCAQQGSDSYDQVGTNSVSLGAAISRFQSGVLATEEKFKAFTALNSNLGSDCGSMSSSLASVVGEPGAAPPPPVPGGKSPQGESTITGNINKSKFPGGVAPADVNVKAASGGALGEPAGANTVEASAISQSGASGATASGSGQGITAGSAGGARSPASTAAVGSGGVAGKDSTLASPQFGGQPLGGAQKGEAGKSEEMAVNALLSGKAGSDATGASSAKGADAMADIFASAHESAQNADSAASARNDGTLFERVHYFLRTKKNFLAGKNL